MPNINEMLLKLKGFQYATSLDVNMGYYYITLSDNTSNLCTIIIPWGGVLSQTSTDGNCKFPRYFPTED